MKIIYDKNKEKIIWRGQEYMVDGVIVTSFPTHILYLTEVITSTPIFDIDLEYLTINWVIDENNMEYRKEFTVNLYTELELDKRNWKYDNYVKKMVLAESVIFTHVGFYAFLQLEGFPIEKRNDYVHVWINIIREDHQDVVDGLIADGLLTIEEKPY